MSRGCKLLLTRRHSELDQKRESPVTPSTLKQRSSAEKTAPETGPSIETVVHKFIAAQLQDVQLDKAAINNLVQALTDAVGRLNSTEPQMKEISVEPKEWRNLLRHLANLVSYMMKSSSIFTNFAALFCRKGAGGNPKRDLIKSKSVKFAEEIFERHRVIVQLIKRFETDSSASLASLLPFAKKISESGKEELTCQEDYLSSVIEALGKD